MADAKAKIINLLLYEGDLEGVISIEDFSWNLLREIRYRNCLRRMPARSTECICFFPKAWSMLVSPLICQKNHAAHSRQGLVGKRCYTYH